MECTNAVLHFAFFFLLTVFRNRTLKMDFNKEKFYVHLPVDPANPTSKNPSKRYPGENTKYCMETIQRAFQKERMKCPLTTNKNGWSVLGQGTNSGGRGRETSLNVPCFSPEFLLVLTLESSKYFT